MADITVLTPTYNRAYIIERTYRSLIVQKYQDFKWMIIDDGSNDNTKDVIDEFIKENRIQIEYYYKENGGKHTALNFAYSKIDTPYCVILDSDDELTEDALLVFSEIWEKRDRSREYWCISARCLDGATGELVGKAYPDNINDLKFGLKKRIVIGKSYGEKCTFYDTSILTQFPFPVYKDTKYVTEDTIWLTISKKYDQLCTNKCVRIYHQNMSDSLARGYMHSEQKAATYFYFSAYIINNDAIRFLYNPKSVLYFLHFSRCAKLSNKRYSDAISLIESCWKKIVVTLFYPFGFFIGLIQSKRCQKNE